jgi:RNA polymerase sigma factor (sigma-70 family)
MSDLQDCGACGSSPTRPTFESLYREHFSGVLASVHRFGVAARDAEDVTQDVFIALFMAFDRYDPSRPLRPWVKAITYRTARDFLELARTREHLTETAQSDHKDTATDPERHLIEHQARDLLRDVLQSLDHAQRTIFLLAEIDQLTYLEIADVLGISETTVQCRLRRARDDFEKALHRKRVAEERRSCGVWLPLALFNSAALTEANRMDPDVSAEVRRRVWRQVRGRMRRTLGNVGRSLRTTCQLFAISAFVCSLVDGSMRPVACAAPTSAEHVVVLESVPPVTVPVVPEVPAEAPPSSVAAPTTAITATKSAPPSPRPRSSAEPETAFYGCLKLLRIARRRLAAGSPGTALDYLIRHERECSNIQASIREMLRTQAREQIKPWPGK